MPTISLESFPLEERIRVERELGAVRIPPSEVTITKASFALTRVGGVYEMVTFVHGRISRTYASPAGGGWIDSFAVDLAKDIAGRPRARGLREQRLEGRAAG